MDLRDDRGIAMVTAVMVLAAVAAAAATAFSISQHDLGQSGVARSRLQSVNAAEAGLDRYFLQLGQTSSGKISCDQLSGTLSSSPPASYTVTPTFEDANQMPMTTITLAGQCVPLGTPAGVLLKSVGLEGSSHRTMESFVRLAPPAGGSLGTDAIFSGGLSSFLGQLNLNGSPDNADIYSVGNISLGSGTIWGTVRSLGSVTLGSLLSSGPQIKRDVVAKTNVSFGLNSVVSGATNASSGSINALGALVGAKANGGANACTGISLLGLTVLGGLHPNACPTAPSTKTLPSYVYDAQAWTLSGYNIQTFTGGSACTDARNWIQSNLINGAAAGNYLLRVNANCTLALPTGQAKLGGNLALALDCGLDLTGGGYLDDLGVGRNLHILAGLALPSACGDGGQVTLGSNSIRGSLTTLLRTTGKISLPSGALTLAGQIIGGSLDFKGNLTHTYKGVTVPGLSTAPFNQDIAYIREIK